ncbi:hypothetical protein NDU88_002993 [Pleurodeles waltl]|uniref:Uncharacterized protein n=1 Tax=Pleurodeles waltl TaxID=8319 RepID=A0AAV7MUD1_PLEWA|nr:hypothetical protein NDU88_002993 [Pleurodeles waltl]
MEWDAFKATLRGHCMGLSCSIRRQLDQEVSTVERRLLQHESEAIQNPGTLFELQAFRKTHSELLKCLKCLNYAAQLANTHAKANRAGTLLAQLIRQDTLHNTVMSFQTSTDGLLCTQDSIHAAFYAHYESLYDAVSHLPLNEINQFLTELPLPKITAQQCSELDGPLLLAEV